MIVGEESENAIEQSFVSTRKAVITKPLDYDLLSGVVFDDFHFLLSKYLLPLDLQQLVRVNHFWHDKIRYDVQRFYISDEMFTWTKSFDDFRKLAEEVLNDMELAWIEDDDDEDDDEDENESQGSENLETEGEEMEHPVLKNTMVELQLDEDEGRTEDQGNHLGGEENRDSYSYNDFLRELDYIQGSSHRNIGFDDFFFDIEHDEYRNQLCQLMLNPAKQLCLFLRNTTITDFASFGIRPWKIVFLLSRINCIQSMELPYFNHIDTVELHGDLTLHSLDGLSGIRVLNISHFQALKKIGGQLSSLEEVWISNCLQLETIRGLESVKRARLEYLPVLYDISPMRKCEQLYLNGSFIRSVNGLSELRCLTVFTSYTFRLEVDSAETMPMLQSLTTDINPVFIPFVLFPNLQHVDIVLPLLEDFTCRSLPLSLRRLSMKYRRENINMYGGLNHLSRFRYLQELTIMNSSITTLTMIDSLSQPLRKISIIDCKGIMSLNGLRRVPSVVLIDLNRLPSLQGINPYMKSLYLQQCEFEHWWGLISVKELTIDYAEKGEEKVSDLFRFGKIVKQKLTLRRSRMIDVIVGVENIPILELERCTGLVYFANLQSHKIIFDKQTVALYGSKVQALSARNGLYSQEDYGDKIVLLRK